MYRGIPHAILDWLKKFTDPQVEGLEHIPRKGPVLVIPNHSGLFGWDAFVLQNEILKQSKRIPRTMTHNFWHQEGFLRDSSRKLGYIPQDFKQAIKVLKRNNLLILFPEAEAGNFKSSLAMYTLQPFNPGFISLAIMTNSPIIPCCIIGAEETHLNLGTIDWTEKLIGAKIPLPLNLIPIKVQWKIVFLPPVRILDKYNRNDAKNIRFLEEAAEVVRLKVQHRIHKELYKRGIFNFTLDG